MRNPFVQLRRGFTLIELLVVMSILVILLAVALPVFNYVTAARSTESGVNMVSAMLGRARTLSLNSPADTYVGVLFYRQAEDERDAMQLVELAVTVPPDRYAHWQNSTAAPAEYYLKPTVPTDPPGPGRYYFQSQDRDLPGVYRNRPMVKNYEAQARTSGSTATAPPAIGTPFTTLNWTARREGNTTPVLLDSEVQRLPRGVRVRVIKQIGNSNVNPGIIAFDKQGRLAIMDWGIINDTDPAKDGGEMLLAAMGREPTGNGQYAELPIGGEQITGMGVAVFNEADLQTLANPKDETALRDWTDINAVQLTVGTQSGELTEAK